MSIKKNPLISIIMNCHNGEKYLKQSVESVLRQSYKKWELIFYDNLSYDNSLNIIESFKDKRIKIYKSSKYLKLYDARNQAIKKARGIYITFLDVDDWWSKNKIELQIKEILKTRYKIVYSNYYIYNQIRKSKKIFSNHILSNGHITQKLLNKYVIAISTVMIHFSFFKKKKFNKNYEIIGDFDFLINLSTKNKIATVQKPLLFYRTHDKNFSKIRNDLHIKELETWLKKNSKKNKK